MRTCVGNRTEATRPLARGVSADSEEPLRRPEHFARGRSAERTSDSEGLTVARIKDVGVILWLGLVVWAILHLVFYRSSAPHGPDMVGEEVSGFLVPLLISLAPAIGLAAIRGPLPRPVRVSQIRTAARLDRCRSLFHRHLYWLRVALELGRKTGRYSFARQAQWRGQRYPIGPAKMPVAEPALPDFHRDRAD
jgi:hypothetical protein